MSHASCRRASSLVFVTLLAQPFAQAQQPGEPAAMPAGAVDEIVVTARRREETLQDVPVAVSAFSAQALENQQVLDLEDLNLGAPNLTIVRNTGTNVGAQIYVRGVGQDDSSFTNEPTVGVYLDDVYIGRQIGAMLDLLDFERIEVLRGPQGTLYGRNSSGGAVKYVSRRPDLQERLLTVSATAGSRDRRDFSFSGSLPLVEGRLALKLDAGSRDQDGWLRVVNAAGVDTGMRANAVDSEAGRVSLLWQPSDSAAVYFNLDAARNRSGPQGIVSTNCTGRIVPPVTAFTVVCPFRFDARASGIGAPDINHFDAGGASLTVDYDFGAVTLESITAFRAFDDDLALDLSGNPAAPFNLVQFLNQDQLSQEVQLASDDDGGLGWLAGLYYFDESVSQDAVFTGNRNVDAQDAQSYAVYGELYFSPTERLTLTLGGRYTWDEKEITRRFFFPATAATPMATLPPGDDTAEGSRFTPKLGVDYDLSEDVLLYASYASGYKSGGFAAARPTSPAQLAGQFGNETVDSFEIGVKSELLDRALRLNAAGFWSEYENLQSSVLGGDGSFTVVTGDARFYGIEVETAYRPNDALTLYGVGGWLKDKWTKQPAGIPTAIRLKHVPRSHFKLGGQYQLPLGERGELFFGANYRWTDEIFRSTANHRNILSPSYGLVDAQLGFESAGGRWRVTLAGQNLADKVYFTQGVSTLGRYLGEPRSYSVGLRASF
jgi:iron complex outermembrane receptor protein